MQQFSKILYIMYEFDYMRYRHDADWLSKQIGRYSFRRGKLVEQPTTLENMSKAVYSEESKRWRFCTDVGLD